MSTTARNKKHSPVHFCIKPPRFCGRLPSLEMQKSSSCCRICFSRPFAAFGWAGTKLHCCRCVFRNDDPRVRRQAAMGLGKMGKALRIIMLCVSRLQLYQAMLEDHSFVIFSSSPLAQPCNGWLLQWPCHSECLDAEELPARTRNIQTSMLRWV